MRTGDIAVRTADGLYRIVGRASRFVKITGLRLALDEIEAKVRQAGWVNHVAGSDEGIVVAVTGQVAEPERLKAELVRQMKIPAMSLTVVRFEELPTLTSGKPDYQAILVEGRNRISEQAVMQEHDSAVALRTQLMSILEQDHFGDDESFMSAGGDSLSFVEASLVVEEYLGRPLPGWERLTLAELIRAKNVDQDNASGGQDPLLVARAVPIGLALTSHAFSQFGVWKLLPEAIRLLTCTATPCFLIIFGLGLARSYLDRPEGRKLAALTRRAIPKAVTIYLAMALTQVCALVGHKNDLTHSLRALLFDDQGRYIDVLMIYCALYVLVPLLIAALERWHLAALLVLLAAPWVAWPALQEIEDASYFLSFTVGAGGNVGPSVLHATSFVLFGYCLGAFGRRPSFAVVGVALVLLMVGVLAVYLARHGVDAFVHGLSSFELRRQNQPVFYAFGVLSSLGILGMSLLLVRIRSWMRGGEFFFGLGANSIFAFTFGNMILNLGPARPLPLAAGLFLSSVFLVGLSLLTYDVMRTQPRFFGPVALALQRATGWVVGLGHLMVRRLPFSRS